MNAPLSDPGELRRIADLDSAVIAHDTKITAAEQAFAELRLRRTALAQRLNGLRARRPTAPITIDASLVDALAADPTSTPAGDTYEAALDRQRSARAAQDAWEVELSVLEAAIGKVDGELQAAQGDIDGLRAGQEGAWATFVREAHGAVAAEFRARFVALRDELIEPLLALAEARSLAGDRIISSDMEPRLTADTRIALTSFVPMSESLRNHGWNVDLLYPDLRSPMAPPPDREPHLARFRTSLGAGRGRRR